MVFLFLTLLLLQCPMGIFNKHSEMSELDQAIHTQSDVGPYRWFDNFTWIEVASPTHYQENLKPLLGVHEGLAYINCEVVREPTNSYNPKAIMILVKGRQVGYIQDASLESWHNLFDSINDSNARLVGKLNVHEWKGMALAKAMIQVDRELMSSKKHKKS